MTAIKAENPKRAYRTGHGITCGCWVELLVLAAAACAPEEAVDPEQTATGAVITNRNLDILFMVDNSSSMLLSQANLLDELSDVHGRAQERCPAECPTFTSR